MSARAPHWRARLRFAIGVAIAATFAASTARDLWWRGHPDRAFAHYTGTPLPPDIVALRYDSVSADNFFDVGHYWRLRGAPERIDAFARANGFTESTEDARWAIADAPDDLNPARPAARIRIGYEREQARDDWIVVYDDGLAIYREN
jgi:hypothetical protein